MVSGASPEVEIPRPPYETFQVFSARERGTLRPEPDEGPARLGLFGGFVLHEGGGLGGLGLVGLELIGQLAHFFLLFPGDVVSGEQLLQLLVLIPFLGREFLEFVFDAGRGLAAGEFFQGEVIQDLDPRLEGMARTLGLGRVRTFVEITLPLARRGLLAAAVLGFSRALGEFGATVIVAGSIPGRTQTLALAIFNDMQIGHDREAMTLVAVTVVLAFAAVFTVEILLRKRPRSA